MGMIFQLAWRFRRGKRQNTFISFISASSTIGIALGCAVLILLLSVMNGFEAELKNKLLNFIPHGEVYAFDNAGMINWQDELQRVSTVEGVRSVSPYVKASGLLQKGNTMKAIPELIGILPSEKKNGHLVGSVNDVQWQDFIQNPDSILLGQQIVDNLGVGIGDTVQLLLPRVSDDLTFQAPTNVWLTVEGVVSIGGELDNQIGFMHLDTAAESLGVLMGAQGLRVKFDDPFEAPTIMRLIGYSFDQHVYMSDWTRTQGHLYQDIQLLRVVVYIALTLVIAVACFNIISTLFMSVNEKQGEIAMLKTMGARERVIVQVFMLQGIINGVMGTLTGVFLGVLVAENLTKIARFIENTTGIQFLSGDVYFIDFLPSQLDWNEVYITAAMALVLSLVSTVYPAIKAARVQPAQALGQG